MKTFEVFAGLDFNDKDQARAVHPDHERRAPRFALSEGEEVQQFHTHSPAFETR